MMDRILIATSNPGKLRDFAGAAPPGIEIAAVPNFERLPLVVEDGLSFEANARKKAEQYSQSCAGELVLADDSGLEVDFLGGAPGVHSARYALEDPRLATGNTGDQANNQRLLGELKDVPFARRGARFVAVLAVAREGRCLELFRGSVEGNILEVGRGGNGFGYDPLFYFPAIDKTFAELSPVEKSRYSHRGEAFRKFLAWHREQFQTSSRSSTRT
jgi:XTP/dITP diphosphohydrolase